MLNWLEKLSLSWKNPKPRQPWHLVLILLSRGLLAPARWRTTGPTCRMAEMVHRS